MQYICRCIGHNLKHCCKASNANPLSSEAMRSGLSCMTVLSLMCLSELCQLGTRCSMCLHSVAFPSSLHLEHASSTLKVLNMGSWKKWSFQTLGKKKQPGSQGRQNLCHRILHLDEPRVKIDLACQGGYGQKRSPSYQEKRSNCLIEEARIAVCSLLQDDDITPSSLGGRDLWPPPKKKQMSPKQ
jgi:hypothetical protein